MQQQLHGRLAGYLCGTLDGGVQEMTIKRQQA